MGKTRELACVYYQYEGKCSKNNNKKCRFYHEMQTCDLYQAKRGGVPARKDLRREKKDKLEKDKRSWE